MRYNNVNPRLNGHDIEQERATIRRVFNERIVHDKGVDRAQAEFDRVLMPTPEAVMEGAKLIADGCEGIGGLGAIMVVDPGGATTDVHSIAGGEPSVPGVTPQGLPEPRIKRTVEGDLGMRHNAATIVEAIGLESIAASARLAPAGVSKLLDAMVNDPERLPQTS